MPIYELAAVLAAACWALSGILSTGPVAHLGPIAFTRIRMAMVFVMLAVWVLISGSWQTIRPEHATAIVLSGIIGVFVGDTLLFVMPGSSNAVRLAMTRLIVPELPHLLWERSK